MPGLKDIISGGMDGLLSGAKGIITAFKADPTKVVETEAKLKELELNLEVEKQKIEAQLEAEITKRVESENAAVTSRWTSDMASDSWLSKNTRPLVLIALLLFLFAIIIADSVKSPFEVKEDYVDLMRTLLELVSVAYFGGRTFEKYQSMRRK